MTVNLPIDLIVRILSFAPLHQSALSQDLWQARTSSVSHLVVKRPVRTTQFRHLQHLSLQGSTSFPTEAMVSILRPIRGLSVDYWDLDASQLPFPENLETVHITYSTNTRANWPAAPSTVNAASLVNSRFPDATAEWMDWIGHRRLHHACFYAGPTLLRALRSVAQVIYPEGPAHMCLYAHARPRASDVDVFTTMFRHRLRSISVNILSHE